MQIYENFACGGSERSAGNSGEAAEKEYSVDSCEDGEEALDFLSVYSYDIVLLDIMLPKLDGMEVLRRMRQRGMNTPVLLLTAKNDIKDRVLGLDSGADDYLVKPFSYEELLAGSGC